MATYIELYDLQSNTNLRNKVGTAMIIKAQQLIDLSTPTANQLAWASNVLINPSEKLDALFRYVLAKNSNLNTTQIQNATDAAIFSNVDSAANTLIAGGIF